MAFECDLFGNLLVTVAYMFGVNMLNYECLHRSVEYMYKLFVEVLLFLLRILSLHISVW